MAADDDVVATRDLGVMTAYLRRPPPPEREREAPTLEEPRWLALFAAAPLDRPLDAPPNALLPPAAVAGLLRGMLRLPTRSAAPVLPAARFAPGFAARSLAAALPVLRVAPVVPPLGLPLLRFAPEEGVGRAAVP